MYFKHHIKTEPTYIILTAGHVQINNIWKQCVIYQDIESKKVYVREESDFELKFRRVEDE